MDNYLLGQSAFWLGNIVIVTFDPERTDLVETLEGELDFFGVFPGPTAMYGTVKEVDNDGNLSIHFLRAMHPSDNPDNDTNYDFKVPRGAYIVVSRRPK